MHQLQVAEKNMTIYITKKTDSKELENLIIEAWASGERFIVQREDGISAAIVSSEDLKLLEEMDQQLEISSN